MMKRQAGRDSAFMDLDNPLTTGTRMLQTSALALLEMHFSSRAANADRHPRRTLRRISRRSRSELELRGGPFVDKFQYLKPSALERVHPDGEIRRACSDGKDREGPSQLFRPPSHIPAAGWSSSRELLTEPPRQV